MLAAADPHPIPGSPAGGGWVGAMFGPGSRPRCCCCAQWSVAGPSIAAATVSLARAPSPPTPLGCTGAGCGCQDQGQSQGRAGPHAAHLGLAGRPARCCHMGIPTPVPGSTVAPTPPPHTCTRKKTPPHPTCARRSRGAGKGCDGNGQGSAARHLCSQELGALLLCQVCRGELGWGW